MRFSNAGILLCLATIANAAEPKTELIRSAKNGNWSDDATWEGGKVPGDQARVQIRTGHALVYDVKESPVIRSLHIAGNLAFATDRNTQLSAGLIKIQAGDDASENGFDCEAHVKEPVGKEVRPSLEIGTQASPLDPRYTANIRLVYIEGMDKETCPAIVCCGGRLDLHGDPLSRTWVKLGAPGKSASNEITLNEAVEGWKVGDRLIITATLRQNKIKKTFLPSTLDSTQTEERTIAKIDGTKITLNEALKFDHMAEGDYRADVANLSRNVVVESADPKGVRGHTMFHRYSSGSLSYAEFRHLGKEGVLGKYSIHYHQCGDTMRGSSVVGVSVWDSHNRWITIHGTNFLVVRDCIGYRSKGHGFFLEDGTEINNVLDRNLAVQAYIGKPLPKQVLPFDLNDGAGFWWSNCHNVFTRNVAADCDEYGYFFQVTKNAEFDPNLMIRKPDGAREKIDIRTLPFIRFEDNEAHCQRRHSCNLGGGAPFGKNDVGAGPDIQHPLIIRNLRLWNVHWGIHPAGPSVLVENLDISNAEYGVWRPSFKQQAFKDIRFTNVPEKLYYAFTSTNKAPNAEKDYPKPLDPVDDLPPVTVITKSIVQSDGKRLITGTTSDNGTIKKVLVNGLEAKATRPNFAEWTIVVDAKVDEIKANAEDEAGNVEKTPHVIK